MGYQYYVVVYVPDGSVAHPMLYKTRGAARTAIKLRHQHGEWFHYAVAEVTFDATIISTIDSSGKWTEVGV